jgi:hypothetical protein
VVSVSLCEEGIVVEFMSGSYLHYDAPQSVYGLIAKSESVGKAVNLHLKNKYQAVKLDT